MKLLQRLVVGLAGTAVVGGCATEVFAGDGVFFSWERTESLEGPYYGNSVSVWDWKDSMGVSLNLTTGAYAYCPQPGHSWELGAVFPIRYYVHTTWNSMALNGLPVALLIRSRNAPWDYDNGPTWDLDDSTYPGIATAIHPDQLALSIVARGHETDGELNYVLGDIELTDHIDHEDVDDWMKVIEQIVTGDFSGDVEGDPDAGGTEYGDESVDSTTVEKWEIKYGNYRMHRYPLYDHDVDGVTESLHSDVTIAYDVVAATSGNVGHRHDTFVNRNLNVLMPVTYTYTAQVKHVQNALATNRGTPWTGEWSPNVRSAYLWCGVESFSSAVRLEIADGSMDDKEVIPWVAPFEGGSQDPTGSEYLGAWMPPSADFLSLIKHLRMRGSDGFYFFGFEKYTDDGVEFPGPMEPGGLVDTTNWSLKDGGGAYLNPWYDAGEEWADPSADLNGYNWFEAHALVSWEELDGLWGDDAEVLRLETDKESGIVVSAMHDMGRLHVLVSYMLASSGSVDLDSYFHGAQDYFGGTGVSSISVGSYSHTVTSDFFTPDIDNNGATDFYDITLYMSMYNAVTMDDRADWDRDGDVDSDDLALFIAAHGAY